MLIKIRRIYDDQGRSERWVRQELSVKANNALIELVRKENESKKGGIGTRAWNALNHIWDLTAFGADPNENLVISLEDIRNYFLKHTYEDINNAINRKKTDVGYEYRYNKYGPSIDKTIRKWLEV